MIWPDAGGPPPGAHGTTLSAVGGDWLVGREPEVTLLRELVTAVVSGVGGAVLVEGEQGIGKTTLLAAGLAEAATAGCQVAWAAADELGQDLPLGLMTECLRAGGWLGDTGEETAAGGMVLAADPVLAEAERLLALVDRMCAAGPCLVVAEDLHWADAASVQAWGRLTRAAGQMPLLVVGSGRPAPGREDLTRLRRSLAERAGHVVSLGALPPAQLTQVVAQAVGGRPGQRLAGLAARAGGNPLYARELAEALVRDGRVRAVDGVAELAGDSAVPVPESLAGAITSRLAALSADTVRVLRWAAVLGPEFTVTDLELVTGQDADELMRVVAEALTAGVVIEAGPRLAFRHGLIRQALHEAMPVSARSAVHLQAARAMAEAGARAERVAAQLAAVRLAAAPEMTTGWVADWLVSQAPLLIYRAPRLAAELLRSVLAELSDDDPRQETLLVSLATVAFLLDQHDEAQQVGLRVLTRTRDDNRAAEVAWLVAYTMERTGQRAEAAAMIEAVLRRLGAGEAQVARLLGLQAVTVAMLGRLDESEQAASEALARAEAVGDRFAAGYALHARTTACMLRPDQAGMVRYADQALATIGDDPRTADLRVMLLANKAGPLAKLGHDHEALATVQQSLALAERTGVTRTGRIRVSLAFRLYSMGQWDDALAELEQVVGLPGPDNFHLRVHGLLALIAGHKDERETAREHLSALANVRMRDAGLRAHSVSLLSAQAVAAEQEGRPDTAVRLLAACLDPVVAADIPDLFELLPLLARLALTVGDNAAAAAACRAASTAAEREPLAVKVAVADHCRGLLAADPEPIFAAARYHLSAERTIDQGQALEDAAVLLASQGGTKAARAHFTEAVTVYDGLGAAWDVRRAGGRLGAFGIQRGRGAQRAARPATGWAALTRTELKVARLVAVGESNPDIAAELFLSRNTVQTHVSHILAKLGAQSRAAIVREALQHSPAAS